TMQRMVPCRPPSGSPGGDPGPRAGPLKLTRPSFGPAQPLAEEQIAEEQSSLASRSSHVVDVRSPMLPPELQPDPVWAGDAIREIRRPEDHVLVARAVDRPGDEIVATGELEAQLVGPHHAPLEGGAGALAEVLVEAVLGGR